MSVKLKIGTRWFDEDTLQCYHDGLLVAEAFFNGGQWIFFEKVDERNIDSQHIPVDPELELKFQRTEEKIAAEPDPTKRSVLYAELVGRRKMYRDDEEARDLVRMRSTQLSRQIVRNRLKEV